MRILIAALVLLASWPCFAQTSGSLSSVRSAAAELRAARTGTSTTTLAEKRAALEECIVRYDSAIARERNLLRKVETDASNSD